MSRGGARKPGWILSTLIVCATLATAPACAKKSRDEPATASPESPPYPEVPSNGQVGGERNLAVLLDKYSQGQAKKMPWAGYWWPYVDQGTIQALSKYEAAGGSNAATQWEISYHGPGVPGVQSWWGHCNGWAAASVLFEEPRTPKGVSGVTFGIADQKALLSEIGMEVQADFFGMRSETSDPSSSAFQDVYPNQFFLVLTNYVGLGFPVIMDRYTGDQVWNHPIAGYRIDPVTSQDDLGVDPSSPSVHRVSMGLQVWWVRDDVVGDHLTAGFDFLDNASFESRVLRFELWLDGPLRFDGAGDLVSSGNVILPRQGNLVYGGQWRNGGLEIANSHPDYMWNPRSVTTSTGFTNPNVDISWVSSNFGR